MTRWPTDQGKKGSFFKDCKNRGIDNSKRASKKKAPCYWGGEVRWAGEGKVRKTDAGTLSAQGIPP